MARDKSAHHEKIIAAAREEFMTYGFTDASMRRIAAAAGMSVAGLYKHFTSKEEMFAALVEPACQGLISLYRLEEAEEQAALQTESLGDKWSQSGDAKMAMIFIYEHLDAFRLLICKSRGTRYESFLHDLSETEEKITLDMMSLLREQGMPIREVDPEEFHLFRPDDARHAGGLCKHHCQDQGAERYRRSLNDLAGHPALSTVRTVPAASSAVITSTAHSPRKVMLNPRTIPLGIQFL